MDKIIKRALRQKGSSVKIEKTASCPDEAELIRYLEGSLPKGKEAELASHITECCWCMEQLNLAQQARAFYKKGMAIHNGLAGWSKKNKWLLGACVAFILSFVFSRYFFQFLILTLLMGIKWILSTSGTRSVVMIYDALKKKGRDEDRSRLHS